MTLVFIPERAEDKSGSGHVSSCGKSEVLTKSVRHVAGSLNHNNYFERAWR